MFIEVCKSKIHRVTVTGADLQYIGSITIDEELMDAANLIENEKVQIVNINNGERYSRKEKFGRNHSERSCCTQSCGWRHCYHCFVCNNRF